MPLYTAKLKDGTILFEQEAFENDFSATNRAESLFLSSRNDLKIAFNKLLLDFINARGYSEMKRTQNKLRNCNEEIQSNFKIIKH